MKRLMGILFFTGVMLIAAAGMMAIDIYLTDDRKTAVRAGISDTLDEGAARHEQRREEGCRRRCGFFGSMASLVNSLRRGVFASMPFDPETVFPSAPEGWTIRDYDLATVERITGYKFQRSSLATPTHNQLMKRFDNASKAAQTAAVRIYSLDDVQVAVAIQILDSGRFEKGKRRVQHPAGTIPTEATVDGLPFLLYPQISRDPLRDTFVPVSYSHYSMDLDGQVRIDVLTRAPYDDTATLLARFDLEPIVETLPRVPAEYQPDGQGIMEARTAQITQ